MGTRTIGRRVTRTGGVLAGAVLAAGMTVSGAAAGTPAAGSPAGPAVHDPGALATQLRHGGLAASQGVKSICAGTNLYCLAEALTASPGAGTLMSSTSPIGYGATDLEQAYHLTGAGSAGTIAVIELGADPKLASDVATYRAQYGLPACTAASGCLRQVSDTGGPALKPATDASGKLDEESLAVETSLDMDMASAACPHCKLLEVQVPDSGSSAPGTTDQAAEDFGTGAQTAVAQGADAISISYGFPSDTATDTGSAAKALFQPGTAVVASSGDHGFNDPAATGSLGTGAPWPQNLPWVTSAGGTSLYAPTATQPGYTQSAWNEAGSGCDPSLEPALGQPRTVSRQCGGHRASADLSAVADPSTGVAVYDSYAPSTGTPARWIVEGGTSVSSPLIAGMYARAGHTAGVTGPNTVYQDPASDFTDITTGQNAAQGTCAQAGFASQVCTAGPGWDGPTGRGTPRGLTPFR